MISLLFLTYNNLAEAQTCFHSLEFLHQREDVEWIIWDNGSSDGTAEWVLEFARQHHHVLAVASSHNLGVAGGRNKLWDMAKGEYLVFLDSDIVAVKEDCLDKLLEPFYKGWLCIRVTGQYGWIMRPDWTCSDPHFEHGDVDYVSGCCFAIFREFGDGGRRFDDAFNPFWCEDVDYCLQEKNSFSGRIWCTGDIGWQHPEHPVNPAGRQERHELLKQKWAGKGLIQREGPPC